MGIEENKAIVKEVWEQMINRDNYDRLYDLFHKDYVYHGPGGHEVRGPDDLKKLFIKIRESMPDLHANIEDLIAEGNKVVSQCTILGTPNKVGKQGKFDDIVITQIVDGKITEEWEVFDRLSIVQQGAKGWFQKRMITGIVRQLDKAAGFV